MIATSSEPAGGRSRRGRLSIVVVACVVSAAVGWSAAQRIKSPAEIAASTAPPRPSAITLPVERRVLSSAVVTRGEGTYADLTEIGVAGGDIGVVTRLAVAPGAELREGVVAFEVDGRPVIALRGAVPAFRALGPGAVGPDVAELEEALVRLGLDPGPVDDHYDQRSGQAVGALYARLGYVPSGPSPQDLLSLDAARGRARAARNAVAAAQLAVQAVGLKPSERLALDRAVDEARYTLRQAKAAAGGADAPAVGSAEDRAHAVVVATSALAQAEAVRAEQLAAATPTAARAQLASAEEEVEAAASSLALLEATTGVGLPLAEVVFVGQLPATVQAVSVPVGKPASGPVVTVRGSAMAVEASVAAADRRLIAVGQRAFLEDDSLALEVPAVISQILDPGASGGAADRVGVTLRPMTDLPASVYKRNIRVRIPVRSTGGAVLAVPIAALSASTNGGARVEVVTASGRGELVSVTTGISADGLIEVVPRARGALAKGDQVVVGRAGSASGGRG